MIVGDPSVFAVESAFDYALERLSLRGVGFFVIHVAGCCYGVKSPDATALANSLDEVEGRISEQGTHIADFAQADAFSIAVAYTTAIYLEHSEHSFFGMSEDQFRKAILRAQWAPDGDEAFDDGSYVLQFDVDDRVRMIAFKSPDAFVDAGSVREVWLAADTYYGTLREWRDKFIAEWKALPKR
jgi:hypothetical protein